MAIFRESAYQFTTNDDFRISLLSTYVGDLHIDSLIPNYGVSFKEKKIKDLPEIVNAIKSFTTEPVEITLKTKYEMNQSLRFVFPKFHSENIVGLIPQQLQSNADAISLHFTCCEGMGGGDGKFVPPKLSSMTQEEAWKTLNLVHKKIPIESALDLPKEKMIIGMLKHGNFCLYYGNDCKLVHNINLSFDLDDGFCGEKYKDDDVIKESAIPYELNEAFTKWKNNNYKGPLFKPQDKQKASISTTLKNFFYAPSRYPVKAAAFVGLFTFAACSLMSFAPISAMLLGCLFSASAYGLINIRKHYAKQAKEELDVINDFSVNSIKEINKEKFNAAHKGYEDAQSFRSYLTHFPDFDLKNYKYYWAGMKKGLSDREKGINEVNKYKI